MSTFEIILIVIIYMFGYGYTLANILSDYNRMCRADKILGVIFCIIFTLYFPFLLGVDIYNKLNSK